MCVCRYSYHRPKGHRKRRTEDELIKYYAAKYYKAVSELLNTVPSDMILLFKTNDCLRHIDKLLGVPVNTITGMCGDICCVVECPYRINISIRVVVASEVILEEAVDDSSSASDVVAAYVEYSQVMLRVGGLALAGYVMQWSDYLWPK